MSQGANVRSVDAIRDFKVALINFAEEARSPSARPRWKSARSVTGCSATSSLTGRRRSSAARSGSRQPAPTCFAASSRSPIATPSRIPSRRRPCAAERQLREAEEKVAIIKKWIPVFEHALSEYHSASQPLGDRLSGSFAATLSLLDRMLGALDAYLAMAPPTAPVAPRLRAGDEEAQSTVASTHQLLPQPPWHRARKRLPTSAGPADSSSQDATAEYVVPHAQSQEKRADDEDATVEYGTRTH